MLRKLKLFLGILPATLGGGDPGPIPKVSRKEVDRWIENCRAEGKNHVLVIFEHNLYDDLREVYPYYALDDAQLTRRLRLIDRGCDATALQIIDLDRDIDAQLAMTNFIADPLELKS